MPLRAATKLTPEQQADLVREAMGMGTPMGLMVPKGVLAQKYSAFMQKLLKSRLTKEAYEALNSAENTYGQNINVHITPRDAYKIWEQKKLGEQGISKGMFSSRQGIASIKESPERSTMFKTGLHEIGHALHYHLPQESGTGMLKIGESAPHTGLAKIYSDLFITDAEQAEQFARIFERGIRKKGSIANQWLKEKGVLEGQVEGPVDFERVRLEDSTQKMREMFHDILYNWQEK